MFVWRGRISALAKNLQWKKMNGKVVAIKKTREIYSTICNWLLNADWLD